jgi:hypothetical protein
LTPLIVKTVAMEAQGIGELARRLGATRVQGKARLAFAATEQNWETRLLEMLRIRCWRSARGDR